MKDLLETAAVGMRANVLKAKVMSALIPDEQHQAVLPGGELLDESCTFNYPNSMVNAYHQGS